MIDIKKQIEYWKKGAEEDWELGVRLVGEGSIRHGLFLVHLSIEKIIKAHVCKNTNDIAPRIHNLVQLADKASILLPHEDKIFLGVVTRFNIEGRYPDSYDEIPPKESVDKILQTGRRVYQWLRDQL